MCLGAFLRQGGLLEDAATQPLAVGAGEMAVLAAEIDDYAHGREMGPQQIGQALDFVVMAQQPADLLGGNDARGCPVGQGGHFLVPFAAETRQARGLGHAFPGARMKPPQYGGIPHQRGRQQRVIGPARTARIINTRLLQGGALAAEHALDGAGAGFGQADMQGQVPRHRAKIKAVGARAKSQAGKCAAWGE